MVVGWVEEKSRIKTNSAKLKLELRLSLAKTISCGFFLTLMQRFNSGKQSMNIKF